MDDGTKPVLVKTFVCQQFLFPLLYTSLSIYFFIGNFLKTHVIVQNKMLSSTTYTHAQIKNIQKTVKWMQSYCDFFDLSPTLLLFSRLFGDSNLNLVLPQATIIYTHGDYIEYDFIVMVLHWGLWDHGFSFSDWVLPCVLEQNTVSRCSAIILSSDMWHVMHLYRSIW